jgi:hypothetical protein
MMAKQPERVSVSQAAAMLKMTGRAVRYAIERGDIDAVMIANIYAIPMSEVVTYGRERDQNKSRRSGRPSSGDRSHRGVGANRSPRSSGRPAQRGR